MTSIRFNLSTNSNLKLKTPGGILVFRVLVQVRLQAFEAASVKWYIRHLYFGLKWLRDYHVAPSTAATNFSDPCCAVQGSTVQCSTVQCSAEQSTELCCNIYSDVRWLYCISVQYIAV